MAQVESSAHHSARRLAVVARHGRGRRRSRRGLTLVEMLVTVAILVIIMTILVQVFQAATGAVSAVQVIQTLDDGMRLLDSTIRSDLGGATASFTPPNDPALGKGYFEYGENEFADSQNEDSDDYVRFTARAPAGQPFTGRMYLPPQYVPNGSQKVYNSQQPITITSDTAEIIYFVRNGNLYRRVLLVVPERQASFSQATMTQANNNVGVYVQAGNTVNFNFTPGAIDPNGNTAVSWQGVNDISAHPTAVGNASQTIQLNTLGDLTNRENRPFYPRFGSDYFSVQTGGAGQDGIPDDLNGDNLPDLYPTFYASSLNTGLYFAPPLVNGNLNTYLVGNTGLPFMAFPYIFPGAYSVPQQISDDRFGLIHSPSPLANVNGQNTSYDPNGPNGNPLAYLNNMNHNPLASGDNLPTPINPAGGNNAQLMQTWWGFPTWRETLSIHWNDPTVPVFATPGQPNGLTPRTIANGGLVVNAGFTTVANDPNLLPAMDFVWRLSPQLFTSQNAPGAQDAGWNNQFFPANTPLWNSLSWEDDLIMTGVRSFDVKAYDNSVGHYVDLGWGDDVRNSGFNGTPFFTSNLDFFGPANNANSVYPPLVNIQGGWVDYINQTFAHEGRMPPLIQDNRIDPQNPNPTYVNFAAIGLQPGYIAQYGNYPNYSSNIGDNTSGIVRLRRVWDSWSTAYSRAPANAIYHNPAPPAGGDPLEGFPWGPPFSPPVYPSYPAPYPAPLRGIQIQIRIADPTNQRIKSLTIRQDFTDKL
jgi:prepilin-type N-terminal cleavage/methylation domain-containing protein